MIRQQKRRGLARLRERIELLPALAAAIFNGARFAITSIINFCAVPLGSALGAKDGAKDSGRGNPFSANCAPVVLAGKEAGNSSGDSDRLGAVDGLKVNGAGFGDGPIISTVSVLWH